MAYAGIELRLVKTQLETSLGEVETKLGRIEGDILPSIISDQQIADGNEVWQGEGSDAFSDEIKNKIKPEIEDILASMREFMDLIREAADNVENMDRQLQGEVQALDADFKAIYRA